MTTSTKRKRAWTCPVCAYGNEEADTVCALCSTVKPDAKLAAPPKPKPSALKPGDLVVLPFDGCKAVLLSEDDVSRTQKFTRDMRNVMEVSMDESEAATVLASWEERMPGGGTPAFAHLGSDLKTKPLHGHVRYSPTHKQYIFQPDTVGPSPSCWIYPGFVVADLTGCLEVIQAMDTTHTWRVLKTQDWPIQYLLQSNRAPERKMWTPASLVWAKDKDWYAKHVAAKMQAERDALAAKLEAMEQQRKCIICMHDDRTHIMLPCFHLCACPTCAQQMVTKAEAQTLRCPVCRQPCTGIQQTFIS